MGPKAFALLVLLAGALCAYEYYSILGKTKSNVAVNVLLMALMIALCGYSPKLLIPFVFGIVIIVFAYNLFVAKLYDVSDTLIDIWGFLYIGASLSVVISILLYMPNWLFIVAYIISMAILNDTMAYFIGIKFGSHKFCPVSPKKSVEGAVAGILTSVLVSSLFGIFVFSFPSLPFYHFPLLGLLAGIAGELGDLCASMIKRKCQVKDFGDLMPGHGGALDRIDNMLFTIMAVYCYYQVLLVFFNF